VKKSKKKKFNPFSKASIILPIVNNIRDTILIHIHGGAFIGSSTFTHENYLRKWCNKLNIPIIGIDYGLSPENKYPIALNDVFQGYNWILNHAKEEFNINFKNIILSGDSAGGNLVIALLYLIITINLYEGTKIQIPNLVFLEYPTTYLGKDNITNSLLFSLNEDLITSNFLQFARDSYGGDYLNFNDPFFSVIKANEKIIKHLPKIRFLFGGKDPLRDDSIRTIYDICQFDNCNIDVKGYELIHFGHGFNASDTEILRKYASDFVYAEIEELIKKTIEEHEHKKSKKKNEPPLDLNALKKFPNDFIGKLFKNRIQKDECLVKGYILDNFPKSYLDCQNIFCVDLPPKIKKEEENKDIKETKKDKKEKFDKDKEKEKIEEIDYNRKVIEELLPDCVIMINNYTEESLKEKEKKHL